jgi:Flp pilus assembly protein TadB
MNTSAVVTIVVVVIAAVIAIALLVVNQRSKKLRERFGPEYSRTVEETGSKMRAEAKLQKLQKRVEDFRITPLSSETRAKFVAGWHKSNRGLWTILAAH